MYEVVLSKQAVKDAKKIASAGLRPKVEKLLDIIEQDPFAFPPHYEKLLETYRDSTPDGSTFNIVIIP